MNSCAGQWFNVRRRLSVEEQQRFGILAVRDVRNKPEEYQRLTALFADAPYLRAVL